MIRGRRRYVVSLPSNRKYDHANAVETSRGGLHRYVSIRGEKCDAYGRLRIRKSDYDSIGEFFRLTSSARVRLDHFR